MSTTKSLKPRSQVEVKVNFRQTSYCLTYLYWNSLDFQVSSHFHLVSIPFQWLFLKRSTGPTPEPYPTALKSHKSRTPLVHHLIPFYFTVSRPGATDPHAKHQALAPSLPKLQQLKSMFVTVLLTFNASARACGQKRCQTKPCETWELTRRSAPLT